MEHIRSMPKKQIFREIKVRPTAAEKVAFEEAAAKAKPRAMSVNQWLIVAGLEKAERDGRVVA
jgi:hypothetical protein